MNLIQSGLFCTVNGTLGAGHKYNLGGTAMTQLLSSVPVWFLIFLVIVLGGAITVLGSYLIFSLKQMFKGLQSTLQELKDLIKELFEDRNDHEARIKAIETRCEERKIAGLSCYPPHNNQ